MDTRRARVRSTVAGFAVAGALALLVHLAGAGLLSAATADPAPGHRAVVAAHDAKAGLDAAPASGTRGHAWFAILVGAVACALFGAYLRRSMHGCDRRSHLRQLSFRLRAPPIPRAAH